MKVRKGSALDWFRLYWQTSPKLARLCLFLLAVLGLYTVWQTHQAKAQLEDSLMNLGEQYSRMGVAMMHYDNAEHQQTPRTLVMNGQPISMATGHTRDGLDTVLDVFEERCVARDGRIKGRLDELLAEAEEEDGLEYETRLLDPTLRKQSDQAGFVACLDMREETIGIGEVVSRVSRFRETMDVSDLGDFRYVYAQQQPDGMTTFFTIWVDGQFDLDAMFPARGDAPGADIVDVPRPAQSRRIFSSMEMGRDLMITMYENGQEKAQVHGFYRREMEALGWDLRELTPEEANELPFEMEPSSGDLLVFERGRRMVAVAAMDDVADGQSTVTCMLEL